MKVLYSPKMILEKLRDVLKHPASVSSILTMLDIPKKHKPSVRKILITLEKQKHLIKLRKGVYGFSSHMDIIEGTLQGHEKGFGFVLVKGGEDVFIPRRKMNGAMTGDTVRCRVEEISRNGKREGVILDILKRAHRYVMGHLQFNGEFGFVIPVDKNLSYYDIYVKREDFNGAEPNDLVEVEIKVFPTEELNPRGVICKVITNPEEYISSLEYIFHTYNLPESFPREVKREAKGIPGEVDHKAYKERESLIGSTVFTIDGEDAKDFDDAVSLRPLHGGEYELGVHIADVSSYVTRGSALDKEAFRRGNSFYFPEKVLPMLPFSLSNGVCSLKPDVIRLTLSCFMKIDKHGELLSFRFAETVIKSVRRFTYREVFRVLQGDDDYNLTEEVIDTIRRMGKLASALRAKRMKEGSIDFDIPEPKVIVRENKVEKIILSERNDAHFLIEEFMLLANICAARFLSGKEAGALYRIHEKPEEEKLKNVLSVIRKMNVLMIPEQDDASSTTLQKIVSAFENHIEKPMVNRMLLRSMQKAVYSVHNRGHYGLGFSSYSHFTSPIRRYADLVVHRQLKAVFRGEEGYSEKEMEHIATHISEQERLAVDAEREYIAIKTIEFLNAHPQEHYHGVISGVTANGLFVELLDFFIDGFVSLQHLHDDYYHYQPENFRMIGERTNRILKLGDEVIVDVVAVDIFKKQIELDLLEWKGHKIPKRAAGKKEGGKGRKQKKRFRAERKKTKEKKDDELSRMLALPSEKPSRSGRKPSKAKKKPAKRT